MVEVANKLLDNDQIDHLLSDPWSNQPSLHMVPVGEVSEVTHKSFFFSLAAIDGGIPQTPDELEELTSSSYDLSVTAAGELNIPIAGSVSGGTSRRVVVLEWTRFKRLPQPDGTELRYGFAVRFCLTVNKWNAELKASLPFLSAQAELGNIQAAWSMSVRGLVGPKINEAVLPPQPLSVETFVTARQSLTSIIAAINDSSTQFVPGVLLSKSSAIGTDVLLRKSAIEAYALYCIFKGRSSTRAEAELPLKTPDEGDIVRAVYEQLGAPIGAESPPQTVRDAARSILNGIKADT